MSSTEPQPILTYIRTHIHTYIHTHTPAHIYICTETTTKQYAAHNPHTICTQYAHTQTENNNMQHTEQNTEYNTENTENTEQHTENRTQPQHTCSAHNYRTYSFDYYYEYAVINNSNTIELYTILQDNV